MLNKWLGIGFKIFSTVVDRRLLKQLALAIGCGVITTLGFLATIEKHEGIYFGAFQHILRRADRIEAAAFCFQRV